MLEVFYYNHKIIYTIYIQHNERFHYISIEQYNGM